MQGDAMKTSLDPACCDADSSRRAFIRAGALSLLGVGVGDLLRAEAAAAEAANGAARGKATAQSCILVWLEGGPSQVDTWDPKPTSSFKPIATNVAGIQISELLPRTARHMDKLAIIRSIRTLENNHPPATSYAFTGHRPTAAMQFPSVGAIVTRELGGRNEIPPHLVIPGWQSGSYGEYLKAAFLGPSYDPMTVPDPSKEGYKVEDLSLPKSLPLAQLDDRRSFLQVIDRAYRRKVETAEYANMDTFSQQALRIVTAPQVRSAFDLGQESARTRDAYGRHSFGQTLLLARRLVEAGTRFVTAAGHNISGWDTHADNDKRLVDKQAPGLDQSLPALLEDLDRRGLLASTIVLVMGEFGRTPHLNSKYGRDHWPNCWSLVIGGGGLRGGQVIGCSDDRGGQVADRIVSMGDVFATIYKAFGIDWRKEYPSPIGRPIKIANALADKTGSIIQELT
jgi:uncharacterized protein (DUF1501 family)